MYSYYYGSNAIFKDEPKLNKRLRFNPDASLDRPDWRYLTAKAYVDMRRAGISSVGDSTWTPSRREDPYVVRELIPYLSASNDASQLLIRSEIASERPGVRWACTTYLNTNPNVRFFVEAMLVGGSPVEEIANELKTEPNYIWHYEKAFFDLLGHTRDDYWVETNVILPSLHEGSKLYCRQNFFWKLVARMFGWERFLDICSILSPHDAEISKVLQEAIEARTDENALIADLTRTINSFNESAIKEEHYRKRELALQEKKADSELPQDQREIQPIVAQMLVAIQGGIQKAPAVEPSLESVKDDQDLVAYKIRDFELVEKHRQESKERRQEELSDA